MKVTSIVLITLFFCLCTGIAAATTNYENHSMTYNTSTTSTLSNSYVSSNLTSASISVTQNYSHVDPNGLSNLTAWWKCDESSGTTLANAVNASNPATLSSSGTFTTGKYNNSVSLSGSQKATFNDPILGATSCTIVLWANRSTYNQYAAMVNDWNGTIDNYLLGYESPAGTLTFFAADGSNDDCISNANFTGNSWHMVTAVFNHTTGELSLYVDTNKATKSTSIAHIGSVQSNSCNIGYYSSQGAYFSGKIDNLAMYNRSLSQAEINQLYYNDIQQLKVKTNANSTYSGYMNGSSTVNVPYATSDSNISSLLFNVPSSITTSTGTTIYNYSNTTTPFTYSYQLTSSSAPVASFTENITQGIGNLWVQFTDLSTNATAWLWNFGDGIISTLENPSHLFGSGSWNVTLNASNSAGSSISSQMILVSQNNTTIYWYSPNPISYGTPLSGSQLNAQANVAGSFVYSPVSGTVLSAGSQTLHVAFTPTDTQNYTNAQANVTLNVVKGSPVVTWSNPSPMISGSTLTGTQLNAVSDKQGTFVYTPGLGTVMNTGTQTLSCTFTPADITNYSVVSNSVSLTVYAALTPILNCSNVNSIESNIPPVVVAQDPITNLTVSGVYTKVLTGVSGMRKAFWTVTFVPTDSKNYTNTSQSFSFQPGEKAALAANKQCNDALRAAGANFRNMSLSGVKI